MERQRWEQIEGENNFWFGRFNRYRLLGSKRSVLAVYNGERQDAGEKPAKSAPPSWIAARDRFDWIARAEAWDAWVRREDEQVWLDKWEEYREKMWKQAQALAEKADLMLRHPHVTQVAERIHVAQAAGEQVPVGIVIKPAGWRMRDIASFYKVGAELARQSVGDAELAIDYLTALGYTVTEPGADDDGGEDEDSD